jgi:hypothetical protein
MACKIRLNYACTKANGNQDLYRPLKSFLSGLFCFSFFWVPCASAEVSRVGTQRHAGPPVHVAARIRMPYCSLYPRPDYCMLMHTICNKVCSGTQLESHARDNVECTMTAWKLGTLHRTTE